MSVVDHQCPEHERISVTLLTGGGDKPYVLGLAPALISQGVALDLVGSDDLDVPQFHGHPGVNFLNLRGNQEPGAGLISKVSRVLAYYVKLLRYVATAQADIFHILWNNKIQSIDRTVLMLYYRWLGKRIVLTAHNVNIGIRDTKDSAMNRFTLRMQYRLSDRIFVHTDKMKQELVEGFGVEPARITIIPFGINNSLPNTQLTPAEAREQLGIRRDEKTLLFFGNIAPYKGLEYLTRAFGKRRDDLRLIIAGVPKNCENYWNEIRNSIQDDVSRGDIILRANFIPDEEAEIYFKAADVLVLPYRHIYQSGVLFTGYYFGLPALAADVGSLKDDIAEGKTGYVFKAGDPVDLARTIEEYFASDLYRELDSRRKEIREYAAKQHSWDAVAQVTVSVYASLLGMPSPGRLLTHDASRTSLDARSST